MEQLGVGVMIKMLGGNEETVEAVKASLGKTITEVRLEPEVQEDGALVLAFDDGSHLQLWDAGRSCCESRYMTTDDNLTQFVGAELRDIEVRAAPDVEDEYEVHEIQFLVVTTSKGALTVATHNEHNGYYGGFWIQARAFNE